MLSWIPILLLGATLLAALAWLLRDHRRSWTLAAAAILFGLAGYGLQGNPGQSGAPSFEAETDAADGAAMVEARRTLAGGGLATSNFLVIADGLARNGRYAEAANILQGATNANPKDGEAWLAMANALLAQAGEIPTPAALYAYDQARLADPNSPGPDYFLGMAMLRVGQLPEAAGFWRAALAKPAAPEDASWRRQLNDRLSVLERLIVQQADLPPGPAGQ